MFGELIIFFRVDTSLLGSSDADKHISFFVNSLRVSPTTNYNFFNIPSTSIIIPCYSEFLEFDWEATSKYRPKCENDSFILCSNSILAELKHLFGKFSEEWLNFIERVQKDPKTGITKEMARGLELAILATDVKNIPKKVRVIYLIVSN